MLSASVALAGGLFLCAAALTGCSLPEPQAGFESVNPQERTAALLKAADAGDADAIPDLISMLDSADPAQRMLAAMTLRRMTGRDFGFHYAAEETQRRLAADRWQRWWLENASDWESADSSLSAPDRAEEGRAAPATVANRGEEDS